MILRENGMYSDLKYVEICIQHSNDGTFKILEY